MPPASFSTPQKKEEFYAKNNEKLRGKYHTDPDFREKILAQRREQYERSKLDGTYQKKQELRKFLYQQKKALIANLTIS